MKALDRHGDWNALTDGVAVGNDVETLSRLREELIAAATAGDIQKVGRISGALGALRERMRLTESSGAGKRLHLSVEDRENAGRLVFEALHSKMPASGFSVVVCPEANCAGSPVVIVTLPSLLTDQSG